MRRSMIPSTMALAAALASTVGQVPSVSPGGARINGARTLADIHDDSRERKRARRAGAWLCVNCWHEVEDLDGDCGCGAAPDDYTWREDGRQILAEHKRFNRHHRNIRLVERGGLKAATP